MLGRYPESGGNQNRTELVAVEPGGMRLMIQPRAADMPGRGMIQQVFLHGIPVAPSDGAQPADDGGPGPALGFHIAREALDIGSPGLEQAQLVLLAPARELAQVQLVRLPGKAAVSGQEPG